MPDNIPMRPTGRTKARRRAVDVIFEADQRGQYDADRLRALLRERLAVSAAQTTLPQFSADIVEGVAEHLEGIDETISTYLRGWTLHRLPSVDRAILRGATWELLYGENVDAPVVIKEAVRLAEQLSGDQSPGFVNSVLDRLRVLAPALREDIAESERLAEVRRAQKEARREEWEAREEERRAAEEARWAEAQARREKNADAELGTGPEPQPTVEEELAEVLADAGFEEDYPDDLDEDTELTELTEDPRETTTRGGPPQD